jgi:hypothetical protein
MTESDLLEESSEAIWAQQLVECQQRFVERIEEAVKLRNNKKARKDLYQQWRRELGDDTARESANYVEALLVGKVGWPKFYKRAK